MWYYAQFSLQNLGCFYRMFQKILVEIYLRSNWNLSGRITVQQFLSLISKYNRSIHSDKALKQKFGEAFILEEGLKKRL